MANNVSLSQEDTRKLSALTTLTGRAAMIKVYANNLEETVRKLQRVLILRNGESEIEHLQTMIRLKEAMGLAYKTLSEDISSIGG